MTMPGWADGPANWIGITRSATGHQPGVGESLPRSDKASNISPLRPPRTVRKRPASGPPEVYASKFPEEFLSIRVTSSVAWYWHFHGAPPAPNAGGEHPKIAVTFGNRNGTVRDLRYTNPDAPSVREASRQFQEPKHAEDALSTQWRSAGFLKPDTLHDHLYGQERL